MQRRVLIAIVCATALVGALVTLWFVGLHQSWGGIARAAVTLAPVDPPEVEEVELTSGLQETTSSGTPPTAAQIEEIWKPVIEASANSWTPWMAVINADNGQVIAQSGIDVPHTPASNMKVLTAFTALTYLDPSATLTTGVSQQGADLYLWGEGDLTLASGYGDPNAAYGRAGIEDIADQVAAALGASGQTYSLHYQSTLFGAQTRWPGWAAAGIEDYAGDVAPFAIDTGRVAPNEWAFVASSTETAANALSSALTARGISISGVVPGPTPNGATVVAEVESSTILDQVRYFLLESDNTMAEQFCELAAAEAGVDPVDFTSSTQNVMSTLSAAGIDTTGMVMQDCSGLDPGSRVPPRVLLGVLQASLADDAAAKPLTRMLPIAGVNGTLSYRLYEPSTFGNLTGKTGFLGRSATFSGVGTTASGANLLVAVGSDDVVDDAALWTIATIDGFLTNLFAL